MNQTESEFNLMTLWPGIQALRSQGRGRAMVEMLRAIRHLPQSAFDHAQLGIEMINAGLFDEAERLLKICEHLPEITDYNLMITRVELAHALFAQGRFDDGLAKMKLARSDRHQMLSSMMREDTADVELIFGKFWSGQPLQGQSILILVEGGAGDLFMHSRYFTSLLADGASQVILELGPSMAGLFINQPGIVVAESLNHRHTADWVTTSFEVFFHYQSDLYKRPAYPALPLHDPDHALAPEAQAMIDSALGLLKVGLITASTSKVRHEPFRSITEQEVSPLLEATQHLPMRVFNLNCGGDTRLTAPTIERYGIADLEPYLQSFSDTAGIVRQLDLVISIDTGPAHLAASLGVPTWLLLAANCDYRWLDQRRHTVWYPSMRLYRQTALGDWQQPLSELIESLQAKVGRKP
jgi:hypothetical protein